LRVAAIIVAAFTIAVPSFAGYRISAWIPPWDANALTSMQSNVGTVNESNPVWYSWNADTTIAKNWNAENSTWRAAMAGSAIVPTIQNVINHSFDATAVQTMLSTAANREAHATAIAQLVTANAFDGIDVDYERIPTASRANFTAFVTTLAAKLHAAGKTLSVSVYAKTSDVTWSGAGAEDWSAIGASADSVKIMAYDYHWATSDPGDITPLSWLDSVATYAESTIPRTKIIIGLPWYGYDWVNNVGAGVSYGTATQRALDNGATITHDSNGEATFTYSNHVVVFNDAASYAAKVNVIKSKHSGIGGFAHWAAGDEDPAIWNAIRGTSTVQPPAPQPQPNPATPPPADFTISGPSSLNVMQGSETSGSFTLIPINSFSGAANVTVLPTSFAGTVAPSTPTVNASSTVTLIVRTTASTLPGVYTMTLRFTSGSLVHDVPFTVTVTALPLHRRAAGR